MENVVSPAVSEAISHVRPVIDRDTGQVVAWVFRLTLTGDGASIFDEIVCPVTTLPKPTDEWTRIELDAWIVETGLQQPKVAHLRAQLEQRRRYGEDREFNIDSLR